MKKSLVLGNNTSMSLSPHIFNYWFKKYEIDGEYTFKETDIKNFEYELDKIMNDENICGFNVTIPFKELILKKLNKIDLHSKKIGAVNFVSRVENTWLGKNSDWLGFLNSINHIKEEINTEKAMVLGFGGASKAIVYALTKFGFKEILIFNRSEEKLKNISRQKHITKISLEDVFEKNRQCGMIINTTPINLLANSSKNIEGSYGYDVVYKPKYTNFLENFNKNKRLYGVSMLVHQAAPCFEAWYGIKPEIDEKIFTILGEFI